MPYSLVLTNRTLLENYNRKWLYSRRSIAAFHDENLQIFKMSRILILHNNNAEKFLKKGVKKILY